ncbi:hypothetical protein CANARDRAFT_30421 [[Candida] arabinofermentans NRRL YB-2248]|uniref:Protein arginine methyltransferase NDUFAF7 n=1 Tax=[Candida] arabinofermentans NRRL YB-2248 TaxID=983967 RepID=A0A1E4SU51_9ASCO|nr:hypothetical protein CANARDRAFT_30421 [[Candida] arabinofermentans NRRL YB-2248]
MTQCLLDPKFGYYTTRDPLNSTKGDFITSPEISQTFGEICGIWYFSNFIKQLENQLKLNINSVDIHKRIFRIIEFGPGRGTLINDILKILNKFVDKNNPIEIVLIEKSDVLIQCQYEMLCDKHDNKFNKIDEFTFESVSKWGNKITWLKDDFPNLNKSKEYINLVMCHEFFDALPINRFIKTEDGWIEQMIDITNQNTNTTTSIIKGKPTQTPPFQFVLQKSVNCNIPCKIEKFQKLPLNSSIELCPIATRYIQLISDLIKSSNLSSGLIIDYGTLTTPMNSLRGIQNHQFVNPLLDPGNIDLSIDVDFGSLIENIENTNVLKTCFTSQANWLNLMGLGYRIDQLISFEKNDFKKDQIIKSYKRLIDVGFNGMGKLFNVLAIYDSKHDKPPGFP